ncbi:hypothetical protein GUA87_03780 [Sneathiella sp. P13V-1]|uniref:hypothetical protein n=1 Tax=Sneathiella sp. P13V-1 TaxID=2697366 RepID=UPI00187B4031|nr:hypothetical protein [Sneathiella sp. P13V-1]MBE7635950.1 hypothetical protein [Sneathiella sp. P13V-1]
MSAFDVSAGKSQTISTKAQILTVHSQAESAFDAWREVTFQQPSWNLPKRTADIIAARHPLFAMKHGKSSYQFFGGFMTASLFLTGQVTKARCLEFSNRNSINIERVAWEEFQFLLSFQLDRRQGLDSVYQSVKGFISKEIAEQIYGKKQISRHILHKVTGVPVEQFRYRQKFMTAPSKKANQQ